MKPLDSIQSFDAHVYFTPETREAAYLLKDKATIDFQGSPVRVGQMVDRKVGPHPLPMFQIQFRPAAFAEMIAWLMSNRGGLTVLVHRVTGNDLEDHYQGALWMGQVLDLDASQLQST